MEIYLVGGLVRNFYSDEKRPTDRDCVITGATQEELIELGFELIPANNYPIYKFRHEKAEFALASRKKDDGTLEFSPDVTLEEDLARRDFTCNAIALKKVMLYINAPYKDEPYKMTYPLASDKENAVDPFNGIDDIRNKVLRPVNWKVLEEDPIRILRAYRLCADYGWKMHSDLVLMIQDLNLGVYQNLVPERVAKEFQKGILSYHPNVFLEYIQRNNLLRSIFPIHASFCTRLMKDVMERARIYEFDYHDTTVLFLMCLYIQGWENVEELVKFLSIGHGIVRTYNIIKDMYIAFDNMTIETKLLHVFEQYQLINYANNELRKILMLAESFLKPRQCSYALRVFDCMSKVKFNDIPKENLENVPEMHYKNILHLTRLNYLNKNLNSIYDTP